MVKKAFYGVLVLLCLLSLSLSGFPAPVSAATWQSKVDSWVLETAAQGETEFLVYLATQADLSGARALPNKVDKGVYVYQTLTSVAARTQRGLITSLKALGLEYRPYWIANMIWVRGDLEAVQSLAGRMDVAHLYANPSVNLEAPSQVSQADSPAQPTEWNISKVNAPQVWGLGYTGEGVVIGGQDTGYQWDHPALKNQYRGWNGASADHDYSWHDAIHEDDSHTLPGNPCGFNSPVPCDDDGHGTHTMGTMVGDDGGDNHIGMAPGGRWIGCRNMEEGWGKPSTYIECYEWFVAPTRVNGSEPRPDLAPDVISNSWGCPTSEGCNPSSLLTPVMNLVSAGIVTTHSAGNAGSACSTVNDPAAIYAQSFTVGATDDDDNIAGFSSRGPVTVDLSNRPKPEISAPGAGVRSSYIYNSYATMSGTSMAAPHVAGLVALLLSAYPELAGQVEAIEHVIEQSALHIPWSGCDSSGVPNNAYGWGRIDALAAIEYMSLQMEKTSSAIAVQPGELITYTVTVNHPYGVTPDTTVVLSDTLPVGTTFVSATQPYMLTGDTIRWEFSALDVLDAINVVLVVEVDAQASGAITNADYAVWSDQSPRVRGTAVVTRLGRAFFLPILLR